MRKSRLLVAACACNQPLLSWTSSNKLATGYKGDYWDFYTLSNGGFYMAPSGDDVFHVTCDNMFEGDLSADALGITACLYAYSHLSFSDGRFAQVCARHYHRLRDYMMEHPEVRAILGPRTENFRKHPSLPTPTQRNQILETHGETTGSSGHGMSFLPRRSILRMSCSRR